MQIELFTVENKKKNSIKYSRDWIDKMIKRNNELYFQLVNYRFPLFACTRRSNE